MKTIWKYVSRLKSDTETKNKLFLFLNMLIFGLSGFLIWFPIQFFVLEAIPWLICFVCYPAIFIGFYGGIIYLGNHKS